MYCQTQTVEDEQLTRGFNEVEFTWTADQAGDVSVDVSRDVGLDLDRFSVEGVSVDCSNDGSMQDPEDCDQIVVGEFQDGAVTEVQREVALGLTPGLSVAQLRATVDSWMEWLFAGEPDDDQAPPR